MFSLEIECDPADVELLVAELWEAGSAGIVELDPRRVRAFFEDGADRRKLGSRYPGAMWREEEDRDWIEASRKLLEPMKVGERFFLIPEWRDDPTPPGRFRISVNPGMAFGTGRHETTRLCIQALEQYVKPSIRVLDVGTGSGILAKAVRLLGAAQVWACDIDPIAVQIAGDGFIGSADAVRTASVDLAVANISPEAIVDLAPELRRVVRPGGLLLASGFESAEIPVVQSALPPALEVRRDGTWALIVCSV
jgi:ribosomal protein L11 methyltransferase